MGEDVEALTAEEFDFLSRLRRTPTSRKNLPLASRAQDRVRQKCRRRKLAEFVGGWLDGSQTPMGWRITEAGLAALDAYRQGRG